uniref:Uncharacterized protein n=1 Tax=Anguilla anguilla TaxID=7936 RepID=A0A0E9V2N1_ANGAN
MYCKILSMTRFPSLKRIPVHMSQNSASVGWVWGPKTSPIPLEKSMKLMSLVRMGKGTTSPSAASAEISDSLFLEISLH